MFDFDLVRGPVVRALIAEDRQAIVDVVRSAYLEHHAGLSVNPRSYFLRFPDKPSARIIALPAYLGGRHDVAGLKWIGSFPENIERNVPRASAVLVLNDYATGYPFALLEASQISAARTAASAVLGAGQLSGGQVADRVLMVGAGVLARTTADFFAAEGWKFGDVAVHDKVPGHAAALAGHVERLGYSARVALDVRAELLTADLVVFLTTAAEPWITAPGSFRPGQVVLNISLRDIGPEIIAEAHNVVDDVDHCLNAGTSPHLAQQRYGHTDFIDGTLAQLLTDEITLGPDKPRIFSPFGLGVLDLAVGGHVHRAAVDRGLADVVPDFFGETERWS